MPCLKEKLLIVDDEASIRRSMSDVLAEIGFRVRSAEDGLSALRESQEEIPDILLSDLNMPTMSGFEFLSIVRHRFPTIVTIAMSGAFSGNEVPSGVAADGFYQKAAALARYCRSSQRRPGSSAGCLNPSAPWRLSGLTEANTGLFRRHELDQLPRVPEVRIHTSVNNW